MSMSTPPRRRKFRPATSMLSRATWVRSRLAWAVVWARAWGMGAAGMGHAPQQPASQPAPGQPGYYVPPGCLVRQDFGLGQTRTKLDKARYLKEQCGNAPGQTCRTSLSRHFPSPARGWARPQIPRFFNLTICQSDNLSAPPMRQPAAPYSPNKSPAGLGRG